VFPLTARALKFRGGEGFRAMLENGLAGTDRRIAEGKPVTPAFLFATLLWGAVRAQVEREIAKGSDPASAWLRVSHHVINEQAKHVAIPRRFGVMMQEIWVLQPRFEQRTKKRVHRMLTHPRFRAAYDFLLLRAAESPEAAELGEWWTQAQGASSVEFATQTPHADDAESESAERDAKAPGRRRRRRGKPAGPTAAAE
jgi:poly(A) polymerase